jgi:drug/metabolite transporter (DMT)-like permease
MKNKKLEAYFVLFLAVFGWALNLVFGRFLHDDLPPFGISFWRWAVALAVLSLIFWRKTFILFNLIRRHCYQFCMLAIFGVVIASSFQYVGLDYTSAIDAGIIITLMPIFITLCAAIILKTKISGLQKLGMIISFLGALVIITSGRLQDIRHFAFNFGDFILVIAAFSWGVYTTLIKKYKIPCTDWELVQITSFISLIMITIVLFAHGKTDVAKTFHHFSWSTIIALVYMGIGASLISYWGWNHGVEILGATDAGAFLYLIPVLSAILSAVFLGEKLHIYHFVGAAIILIGVYLTIKNSYVYLKKANIS